jgi:hypothetical protein
VKPGFAYACQAALTLTDVDRVARLVGEVEAIPRGARPPFLAAQASRFDALVQAQRGDAERAEERFKTAVGWLRELGYRFWLAVAQLEYAEWLSAAGRVDQAEPLATEARDTFARVRARPWLERAANLGEAPADVPAADLAAAVSPE